jgi:hypothetical protein
MKLKGGIGVGTGRAPCLHLADDTIITCPDYVKADDSLTPWLCLDQPVINILNQGPVI